MSTKSTIPVEINSIIKSRSPSPLETPKTMSLVVQLGACNNNIISNQQSSPLAATAVASSGKTVRQFPASPELVASAGGHTSGHNSHVEVINNAQNTIPVPQQTSLVVTSQFQTIYKRSVSTTNQLAKHATPSIVTNNGGQSQRLQTVNVQRAAVQLSHIAPQSKVQVISNVVVPKNTNYVLNKAPSASLRQNTTSSSSHIGNKQVITNNVAVPPTASNHRSLGTAIKSPQILNNFALQSKSQSYITATTVQPLSIQQRGGENIQNNNQNQPRTIVNAKFSQQTTPQTHVISRVIAPISKTQPLKVNTSSMVVQRGTPNIGIKTLPPQTSPPTALNNNHHQKTVQNVSRLQNNIVVQQRSGGIKTIPPQRSSYGKTVVPKTVNTIKQNNFIVKNSIVQPRQNLLSPKSKHQLIVQTPNRLNSVNSNNIVKFHGQYVHESNPTQQTQQQSAALPSVTVVRTVASYEDNNVPSSIANTLFSPNSVSNCRNPMTNNHDEVSQESYLSEDDVISEVRPDYSNCNINPVLFDHNYHLPPPDSPPPSPSKPPMSSPLENSVNHDTSNLSGLNVTQNSPNFLQYSVKRPGEVQDDDAGSTISSDAGREIEPEGEETETAPEGEGDEDSVTRCICEFEHDDGYMICCDKCFVWQHVDCMFIDRQNIQEEYLCERCEPRRVDRQRARAIQLRKREEIMNNGSSSDTSSGSSLLENQTGLNNNLPSNKKRPNNLSTHPQGAVIGQTPQSNIVNRRKNDTTAPIPTRNHRPLSASQRRSRRDLQQQSTQRTTTVVRKNSVVKRRQERKVQSKRKTKTRRQQKQHENSDEPQEFWDRSGRENSTNSVVQLRQWIENYEEAVTNHYSPELRARIMKTKDQQHTTDTKVNLNSLVQASVNVHKCRTIPQVNLGTKILVSTVYLQPNTPIIELRGKYMLGSPQTPGGNVIGGNTSSTVLGRHSHHNTHPQRPGPFLFFYKLPKDGVEVCVDTRTYGNDARFVRRSCKPNAEVRHCIEKGTLHLYLVSLNAIEKNTELTIKHETYTTGSSSTSNHHPVSCACGNPLQCGVNPTTQQQQSATLNTTPSSASVKSNPANVSSTTMVTRRSNGIVHDLVELGTQRKRRGRRTTSTSEQELVSPTPPITKIPPVINTPITPQPMSPTPVVEIAQPTPPIPVDPIVSPVPQSPIVSPVTTPPIVQTTPGPIRRSSLNSRVLGKNEEKGENMALITATVPTEKSQERESSAKDKKKMTREERKMEAIMKAFERLEKQEQRKQESKTRQAHRRESDPPLIDHSLNEMRSKRKKRKGRSRTISTNSSSNLNTSMKRRTRVNSTDSYMTSGDDSSLTSPPLPSSTHDNDISLNISRNSIDNEISNNPSMESSLNTVDTAELENNQLTRNEDEFVEKSFQDVQHLSTEGHAAGLLLALANGGQHNEDHLKSPIRDPDTCSSAGSVQSSPGTPVSSNCLLVAAAVEQITPGFKFPKTKKAIMNEWLNKSPESSVSQLQQQQSTGTSITTPLSLQTHMASSRPIELPTPLSVSTLNNTSETSSSPCRQSLATLVQAVNICSASSVTHPAGGNAKKRWLRQAISEECDSPNSRPESPHAPEMIAPPKKRRLARESLSSEQSFTPPTTPTRPNCLHAMNEEFDADQMLTNDEEYYEEKIANDFSEIATANMITPTAAVSSKCLIIDNESTTTTPIIQMESSPISSPVKVCKLSNNIQENGYSSPPQQPQDLMNVELSPSSVLTEKNGIDVKTKCMMDLNENSDNLIINKRLSTEDLSPQVTPIQPNNISLDPRLRYESPHCLGKVEETLQLLESWTYTPKATSESIPPAKRKLSISEYRQRKQQVGGTTCTTPNQNEKGFLETSSISSGALSVSDIHSSISTPESPRPIARTRTNSASSATSSLSSDDDVPKDTTQLTLELPEKDKGIVVAPAFNSAPTLVERQRENLTARLKREFGLFVPEDDESKKNIALGETTLLGQRLSLRTSSFLSTPQTIVEDQSLIRPVVVPVAVTLTEPIENINTTTAVQVVPPTVAAVEVTNKVVDSTAAAVASTYISTNNDSSHIYPTPSIQIPNGGKNVVPSISFITPFDNPVYPNTTYYTGFPTGKTSYLNETTTNTDNIPTATYSFLKSSTRK